MVIKVHFFQQNKITTCFSRTYYKLRLLVTNKRLKIENEIEYLYKLNDVRFTIADNAIKTVITVRLFFLSVCLSCIVHVSLFFPPNFCSFQDDQKYHDLCVKKTSTCTHNGNWNGSSADLFCSKWLSFTFASLCPVEIHVHQYIDLIGATVRELSHTHTHTRTNERTNEIVQSF